MPPPITPPRVTIRPTEADHNILLLQQQLQRVGFGGSFRADGFPSAELWDSVRLFQMQHIGPNGLALGVDGVVGPGTWWALDNPSGAPQRNGFTLALPLTGTLKPLREQVMTVVVDEYWKDVHEDPDGSNRSKVIDTYWANTGIIGQPWCCAFVSTMLTRALKRHPLGAHYVSVAKLVNRARELGLITKYPRPWDLFAQLRADGSGHVGFASAFSHDGVFASFEGNCGNRLKHGRRYTDTVSAWIDPYRDGQSEIFRELPELAELAAAGTR